MSRDRSEAAESPAAAPFIGSAGARSRCAGLADVLVLLGVLAVLIGFFGVQSRSFLTVPTLRNVVNQIPDLTVVAVGMTLVLIGGGIDLSVGSVLALAGSVLGFLAKDAGWPLWAAIAAGIGVGGLCGAISGLITVRGGIPSFIATLGMLEVARGASSLVTDSKTKYVGGAIEGLADPVAGLGVSTSFLIAIGIVLLAQVILSRTVAGRLLVAVGTNEPAVRLAGLGTRGIRWATFLVSGLLAGLGAVFQVARISAANPNAGTGLELSAIAAAVIGGTSLMGGRGSVIRTFLGVLVIAVLQTGLAAIGTSDPTKRLVTGAVIILAVLADVHRAGWTGWRRGPGRAAA